jgi:Restriction endonuclease
MGPGLWHRRTGRTSDGPLVDWAARAGTTLAQIVDEFAFHGPDQDVVLEWPNKTLRSHPAYGHDQWIQVCLFDRLADEGVDFGSPPNPEIEHLPWLEEDGGYIAGFNLRPGVAGATVGLALQFAPAPETVTVRYQGEPLGSLPVALDEVLQRLRTTRPLSPAVPSSNIPAEPLGAVAVSRPPLQLSLIRTARDAEENAAAVLRWLGHTDARTTRVGTDGGIDVESASAVAQVKMEGIPTARPTIQALYGVATAEGKQGIFFALAGYTAQALEWADRVDLPLFTFDYQGQPEPVNTAARTLMATDGGQGFA